MEINEMTIIETICPVCEEDITISEKEIKLANTHKNLSGFVLVSCPLCCRVLKVEGVPENNAAVTEWIHAHEEDEDWLHCLKFLDDEVIHLPAGSIDYNGKIKYTAGAGDQGLMRREYMAKYGVEPECMLRKMRKK